MRQLTSLDTQFPALETARQSGHVAGLAILDPSTAPGAKLELADIQALLEERLPLLPPLRWRLQEVPLGLDYPYWLEDPEFDLDFHVRELALAAPGTDAKLAEQVARIVSRPLDRSRPLWELYLIQGLESGPRRDADEDPPRGDRRHVGRGDHGPAARLEPRGPRAAGGHGADPSSPPASSRCSRAACWECRATRLRVLRSLPAAVPNLEDPRSARSRAPARSAAWPGASRESSARDGNRVVRPRAARAAHVLQRPLSPHRRFAFGQLSLDGSRR